MVEAAEIVQQQKGELASLHLTYENHISQARDELNVFHRRGAISREELAEAMQAVCDANRLMQNAEIREEQTRASLVSLRTECNQEMSALNNAANHAHRDEELHRRVSQIEKEQIELCSMFEQLQSDFIDLSSHHRSDPNKGDAGGGQPHAKNNAGDANQNPGGDGDGLPKGQSDECAPLTPKQKNKEAEKIILPNMPTAPSFRTWKGNVREAIAAASCEPDACFTWVT